MGTFWGVGSQWCNRLPHNRGLLRPRGCGGRFSCVVGGSPKGGIREGEMVDVGYPSRPGGGYDGSLWSGPGQGGDVCVSNKGETKVDKGTSSCSSDSTSHAVAHKGSEAHATDNSKATAKNSSFAS